jgi:hypothetical protein
MDSMFFEDRRGRRYPRNRIAWIGRSWLVQDLSEAERCMGHTEDDYLYKVFVDGQEDAVDVWSDEVDKIVKDKRYIPAHAGLSLLIIYELDPELSFDAAPIIAWAVADGFVPEPITPAGEWGGYAPRAETCRYAILLPDGRLTCPFGEGAWDNIGAYATDQRAIVARTKKWAAAEAGEADLGAATS